MRSKTDLLKEFFGHAEFREGQGTIVDRLLSGGDALCIMPTGAGKSICYQIPALMFEGITLVISPLISLMKDQVNALTQAGVSAAFLNSSLSQAQYARALQNAAQGKYKLLYVAPERLTTPEFLRVCQRLSIAMVAVDEAHCVSQWGQDFRPSYLKITEFIDSLDTRPVIGAFTATATDAVKKDIIALLKLDDPLVIATGFDRPNLFFAVENPFSKPERLLHILKERPGKSGIIYCATRKTVEEVCALLVARDLPATRYHAGLSEAERRNNQEDFIYDRAPIMVATNAFGMGIDKSNVAFVVHYNMPKNIESYYQEAGRAGRDGAEADCILLYSPQDVRVNQFLIEKTEPNPELTPQEQFAVQKRDIERLKSMTFYCATTDCLRRYILRYFGEDGAARCEKCSNCLTPFNLTDITVDAQKILSCIAKTGQRYGKNMIIDVLRGSQNERLLSLGLHRQSTYGLMKDFSAKQLRALVDYLAEKRYIVSGDGDYPVLRLAPASHDLLRGESTLHMPVAKRPKERREQGDAVDFSLLVDLRQLRKDIAARQRVPAYVVFSDATLIDMCKKKPQTPEEFLEVSSVGNMKLERYGEAFLRVLNRGKA